MIAVWMDEVGGPDVLVARSAPEPEAGPGEVVVAVAFVSVTFVETQVRAGRGPFPVGDLPRVPGNGVGGVVAAVGAGVDGTLVGRRVVTTTGGSGGYASAVAVPAAGLVPVPDGVGLDVATALLADGRTATGLVRVAAVEPGERVLVLAAAGGVGSLLVQLVAAAGGVVVGSAASPEKLDVVRSLVAGASVPPAGHGWPDGGTEPSRADDAPVLRHQDVTDDRSVAQNGRGRPGQRAGVGPVEAVDHSVAGWTDAVGPVDVVFDGVGGDIGRAAYERGADGGRVLRFGMASGTFTAIDPDEAAARSITLLEMPRPTPDEMTALTVSALDAAAEGRLTPVIGQRFPLADAADAHRAIESRRTIGKTLLVV